MAEVVGPQVHGVLHFETGDKAPLDRGVLLGRSPMLRSDVEAGGQPRVIKLPSPDNDLSRNHLEIVVDGWQVLALDLGSTNGTTVQHPGSAPTRLLPGEPVALEPGAVLVLADSFTVVYEGAQASVTDDRQDLALLDDVADRHPH